MSEKVARAKRQSARNGGKPPAPEPEPATAVEQGDPQTHPGVMILRVPTGNPGELGQLQIIPINGMDVLAVPTVLELALAMQKSQIGIR